MIFYNINYTMRFVRAYLNDVGDMRMGPWTELINVNPRFHHRC